MSKLARVVSLIGIMAALLLPFIPASPVGALMSLPVSAPSVESINFYRNLLENGDRLIVIYANIPYTTTPTTPESRAFFWRLISADNTTQLGVTTGYPFFENGYGYNVYSMYFDASENITWGSAFILRLSGSPAAFASPPEYDYLVPATAYPTVTSQYDNRLALASKVISLASNLNIRWSLAPENYLVTSNPAATVLSTYGEVFFRGAIPGLQGLCPYVFSLIIETSNATDRSWSAAFTTNLTNQYSGTWVQWSMDAWNDLFDVDYNLFGIMILFGFCIGAIIANAFTNQGFWEGAVDGAILLVIGSRITLIELTYVLLGAAFGVVYMSYKIWRPVG